MSDQHVLIIGTGSAGKRHAGNLHSLGVAVSCMDPRQDRIQELADATPIQGGYTSLEQALEQAKGLTGAAVTSPPVYHVQQSIACLQKGLPVMLEKPVCPDLAGALELQQAAQKTGAPILLGYTWRWWPALGRVRELLEQKTIGTLRHVKFVLSAHLADWHPWERYQDFFMAHASQGGGALLDESHWLDLMLWLFGMPRAIFAQVEKISDLEIDSDDNVDVLVTYDNGLRVSLHLDLYGRPHERSITFVGDGGGSIVWNENRISVGLSAGQDWQQEHFENERNDMFLDVAKDFLDVMQGGQVTTCTLQDGLRVLELVEACRESSRTGARVML